MKKKVEINETEVEATVWDGCEKSALTFIFEFHQSGKRKCGISKYTFESHLGETTVKDCDVGFEFLGGMAKWEVVEDGANGSMWKPKKRQ